MTAHAEPTTQLTRNRVLVVEDDDDLRFLVTDELEQHRYVVTQAANGLEALHVIEREWPNVILLDMRMPVMDGWRFVAELRRRYGRIAARLIVMTAATDARERALAVNADGWLAKPFELDEVVEAVEHALRC